MVDPPDTDGLLPAGPPELPEEPKTVLSARVSDLIGSGQPAPAELASEPGTVHAVQLVGLIARDERERSTMLPEEPKTLPAGATVARLVAEERMRRAREAAPPSPSKKVDVADQTPDSGPSDIPDRF